MHIHTFGGVFDGGLGLLHGLLHGLQHVLLGRSHGGGTSRRAQTSQRTLPTTIAEQTLCVGRREGRGGRGRRRGERGRGEGGEGGTADKMLHFRTS